MKINMVKKSIISEIKNVNSQKPLAIQSIHLQYGKPEVWVEQGTRTCI